MNAVKYSKNIKCAYCLLTNSFYAINIEKWMFEAGYLLSHEVALILWIHKRENTFDSTFPVLIILKTKRFNILLKYIMNLIK